MRMEAWVEAGKRQLAKKKDFGFVLTSEAVSWKTEHSHIYLRIGRIRAHYKIGCPASHEWLFLNILIMLRSEETPAETYLSRPQTAKYTWASCSNTPLTTGYGFLATA